MALEALLAHIDRQAEDAADSARATARREAQAMSERVETEARTRVARALAGRRVELEREGRACLATLERELRARVLDARQTLIDRVFEEAGARTAQVARSPRYTRALHERVLSALRYLGAEPTVACAPELVDTVREALAQGADGQGEVRVEADAAVDCGAVVRSADGRVRIDETLPARIGRQRARLSIAILERLDELTCGSGGAL